VAAQAEGLRPDTAYLLSAGPRAAAMSAAQLAEAVARLLAGAGTDR